MQDKLIKTNQGPISYSIKKFSRNFALCLIAVGAIAIPITIAAAVGGPNDNLKETNSATNETIDTQTEDSDLLTF